MHALFPSFQHPPWNLLALISGYFRPLVFVVIKEGITCRDIDPARVFVVIKGRHDLQRSRILKFWNKDFIRLCLVRQFGDLVEVCL